MNQIESDFLTLQVDAAKEYSFAVVYDGAASELRVGIRKEDVDVVEIRFFASPQLAQQIQQAINAAPLDVAY
jgi:hypothetical protein